MLQKLSRDNTYIIYDESLNTRVIFQHYGLRGSLDHTWNTRNNDILFLQEEVIDLIIIAVAQTL